MADQFYTHQNAQSAGSIAPAISLYGEHKGGSGGVMHSHGDVKPAVGNFMSPYKKPPRRGFDNPDRVLCAEDGCKAWPMKTNEFCSGHARSKGLIDNWSTSKKGPTNESD